jgi:para-aminobenzoate synthetase component 1
MKNLSATARFAGRLTTGLLDVTHDPQALDSEGYWAAVADFEGRFACARSAMSAHGRGAPVRSPAGWVRDGRSG